MEARKQPGNEIQQKFKTHGISGNKANYVKQEENDGKIGNLMELGNQNEIKVMKTDEEDDGEENGVTRESQQQKCVNLKRNTVTTNDNLCNSSTNASKNNNNDKNTGGTKTVTNTETVR